MPSTLDWSAEAVAAAIERVRTTLVQTPGLKRAWLYGSAARGERLDFLSDLDVALEGLGAEAVTRLWFQLGAAVPYPVDLVRVEDASPLLLRQIQRYGLLLHAA